MLRTARPLLNVASKSSLAYRAPHCPPSRLPLAPPNSPLQVLHHRLAARTPVVLWTGYSTKTPWTRDKEFEKETAKKILEARPDEVSTQSSVRHVFEKSQAPPKSSDDDVLRGLKGDLVSSIARNVRLSVRSKLTKDTTSTRSKRLSRSTPFPGSHTPLAWPEPFHTSLPQ